MEKIHSTKFGTIGLLIIILISLFLISFVSALDLRQVYNPFTQRLDYIQSPNFTGENITVDNLDVFVNLTVQDSITSGNVFTNFLQSITALFTGDVQMNKNLNVTGNVTSDYFYGQPIEGGIDNGIIQADEIDSSGNLNISHFAGLNISYPNMTVRLVSTITGEEIYCNLPKTNVIVPDNAHTAYYVDTNCVVQNIPLSSFVDATLNNPGNAPIFHVMSHSGQIEIHQGLPILNRAYLRSRILAFKTINLDVISGLSFVEEGNLNFTINLGEYVFVDSAVETTIQNLSDDAILEVFYRDGGVYQYNDYSGSTQTGMNLTSCEDASQDLVECSLPTRYRRYFLFLTGYINGDDDTELHQRLARNDITYANLADCVNTVDNPLVYELPDIYTFTAVPLFAYCGQGTDTTFDGSFIDLRTVQSGLAGSDIDTSIFLTRLDTIILFLTERFVQAK